MTILIKGMEMPECCRDCELGGDYVHYDDNGVCTEEKHRCSVTFYPLKDLAKRHEKCPLIEVPTPHGRLIDADAIFEQWYQLNFDRKIADGTLAYWNVLLGKAPTVIEAEGQDV